MPSQQSYTNKKLSLGNLLHSNNVSNAEIIIIKTVIEHISKIRDSVTKKDIILYLIDELEKTSNIKHQKLLRQALEIIISCTSEDFKIHSSTPFCCFKKL